MTILTYQNNEHCQAVSLDPWWCTSYALSKDNFNLFAIWRSTRVMCNLMIHSDAIMQKKGHILQASWTATYQSYTKSIIICSRNSYWQITPQYGHLWYACQYTYSSSLSFTIT